MTWTISQLSKAAVAALVVGILGSVISMVPGAVLQEENFGLHILFQLRGSRQPPPGVLIVTLDKASANYLGLPSDPAKWPRSLHARLIDSLAAHDASVIAFNMTFGDARNPQEDALMAAALRKAGNVVLGEGLKIDKVVVTGPAGVHAGDLNIETLVPPLPLLSEAALATAPFPLPKVPIKINSYWTFKTGAGDTPTLPVVVFQTFAMPVCGKLVRLLQAAAPGLAGNRLASCDLADIKRVIRILRTSFEAHPGAGTTMLARLHSEQAAFVSKQELPILQALIKMYAGANRRYINFYGPPGTIPTISYYQLIRNQELSAASNHRLQLRDRVVFVGISESLRPEKQDGFYTVFSQADGLDLSGVEIAATAYANILEDRHVRPLGSRTNLAIIFGWGAALGLVCMLLSTVIAACAVIALGAGYLAWASLQFTGTGLWYPLITPLFLQVPLAFFGTLLWKYTSESKERRNIREAFGLYLPDDVVDQLAQDMSLIKTETRRVYGTCLMTDAERYTALSEFMEPEELSRFVNQYYEAIFEPVRRNSGTISDVKGDSMLAIWATAQPDARTRSRACDTALEINRAVHQFNRSHQSRQLPTRIGIHSGYISLGHIGAGNHYEYRPVGDIVNTAARIEGLNKYLGTKILASAQVLYQLDDFLTRNLGQFIFAGKSQPVEVYELICREQDADRQQRDFCVSFARAVAAFQRQAWNEAIDGLQQTVQIDRTDGPSRFYLKLCEQYRLNPPGSPWDGTVVMNHRK